MAKRKSAQHQGEIDPEAADEAASSASEDGDAPSKPERQPLPRDDVMERIAAARRDDLRKDGVEIPEDESSEGSDDTASGAQADDTLSGDDTAAAGEDTTAAGEDTAPGDSDTAAGADAGADTATAGIDEGADEPKFKVKINGEEREVPQSELIAGYQMSQAAREALAEAKEIKREAQAERRAAQEGKAPAEEGTDEAAAGVDESGGGKPAAAAVDFRKLAERIQFNDPEDAGAALQEAISTILGQRADQPTPDEIAAKVLDVTSYYQAQGQFGKDFSDITADPSLVQFAGLVFRERVAAYRQRAQETGEPIPPYSDLFTEVGKLTRERLHLPTPEGKPGDSNDRRPNGAGAKTKVDLSSERGDRKRATPQPPAPNSARLPGKQTGQQPQNRDELAARRQGIAEIAKARGQQV